MNDEERVTSISAWIYKERGHRRQNDKDILGQVAGTVGRQPKSGMVSLSRPKGCVSFGFKFRRCVGRVLASNTLSPRFSLKPKILCNADYASFSTDSQALSSFFQEISWEFN